VARWISDLVLLPRAASSGSATSSARVAVVKVDQAGIARCLGSFTLLLIPWSDIERLGGSWYRARVVSASNGKRTTVAAFDHHWSRRSTVRAIRDDLTGSTLDAAW